ncbi:MAG: hypothetical protein P1U56_21125 [Saprospiraceae bacterium]|nr:hypothetical protein [Saprospiraceae bacterium]
MKSIPQLLMLLFLGLLTSCSDDANNTIDTDSPEIIDLRWVGIPSLENDPDGPILDGGNYSISIATGFQVNFNIQDVSIINQREAYLLVNDNSEIRMDIIDPRMTFDTSEGFTGFAFRSPEITLEDGSKYELIPGDRYHFYLSFGDEFDNSISTSWTADLME